LVVLLLSLKEPTESVPVWVRANSGPLIARLWLTGKGIVLAEAAAAEAEVALASAALSVTPVFGASVEMAGSVPVGLFSSQPTRVARPAASSSGSGARPIAQGRQAGFGVIVFGSIGSLMVDREWFCAATCRPSRRAF
jgi:hypothetical protein